MTSKRNKIFIFKSECTHTHTHTHTHTDTCTFLKVAERSNLIKINRMRIGKRKNMRLSSGLKL